MKTPRRSTSTSFPVVGIGASAGGLDAFSRLLEALPSDTGMAFVLVQHLDPNHSSLLAEALTRSTSMLVAQAHDGERLEPNRVYVIPPNADLAILHGTLNLLPRREEGRRPHLPIDFFFRSLAEERGSHAIGVILSGSASDGTEGLRAIKGAEGVTFVQQPESARFDGMPRSALDAGVSDYCLPIPELARELVRLSTHPYFIAEVVVPRADDASLASIFALVRKVVGVDFAEFKAPTIERRLARRMALRRVEGLPLYVSVLAEDPAEVRALYEDVLIHVTSFFRDPELFAALKSDVLPAILKAKSGDEPLRMWVAGCSTGEEVYSIAISLLECCTNLSRTHPIQIFGSDISELAIEKARLGLFSESAMKGVDEERRRRFFTKVDGGWRINKTVRDLCVFVRHDLAKDPPFSKLDLVSCRNVLIYFGLDLQKRVVPTFHYALNKGGVLLLGRTETISGFGRLFTPLDTNTKIYARTAAVSALRFKPRTEVHPAASPTLRAGIVAAGGRTADVGKHLDRLLLARYSPPGVLINDRMEILQFRGETGDWLRPAPGEPQSNLLKMARPGLVAVLRAAVAEAKRERVPVRAEDIEVDQGGFARYCDLVVMPFTGIPDTKDELFIVLFEEPARSRLKGKGSAKAAPKSRSKSKSNPKLRLETPSEIRRVHKLQHELAATEEYLQSLLGEQGQTNEDLNSANEELVSGNEELQSMNEELETAKEELQSTNEELVTVNDELHLRSQEVAEVNSDLLNVLATVDVPILILDVDMNIRRFTPKSRSILKLVSSDIGRPLSDIKSSLRIDDLDARIAEVIETTQMHESEVKDADDRWYRLQIRPYKNVDNKIDGAILSLIDIDSLKALLSEAQAAKLEAERANRTKDDFLAVLSHDLRTPLSSMLLHVELLQQEARQELDAAKIRRSVEIIERGTRTQLRLIDDLLDVSRIVTGKLSIEFLRVDLAAEIRAALEGVAAPTLRKSLKLELHLDENVGHVFGDPARLQQIVTNLVSNAIKFSPEKGRVVVSLDRLDGSARLRVTDDGSGIDPAFLPHVFDRFAQEDGTTVRRHGGLGLGLAIVRHLVEAHGGSIEAKSEGRGKGSSFTVMLPLMKPLAREPDEEILDPRAPSRKAVRKAAGLLKGLRILVVDDDVATRDLIAEMLGRTGAEIRVAASASEAMSEFVEFRPAVLLCDIAMPGEDGYSLLRRVRAVDEARGTGNLTAFAITAFAGEDNRRRALAAGFQLHMAKPIDIELLTQAIADLHSGAPPRPA